MADPIKHVVLLILENHPFDQMLGCFKTISPGLDGVDPAAPKSNKDEQGKEYSQTLTEERQMILDPHHEVPHVEVQLADHNAGFVMDFARNFSGSTEQQRQFIMGYYPFGFLPALHALAKDFMICDQWHASVPGPTWTNRFFALSGTSSGKVNMPDDGENTTDLKGYFQQDQVTLFDRLSEKGISWKSYYHDIPQTVALNHQRRPENAARYFSIERFFSDAAGPAEDFPAFSFIEPNFNGKAQNDDHPPHDVMRAQALLASVYNALRGNAALWNGTLLVLFYDEHGGFYDHVEPGPAVNPDGRTDEYTFDRYGVRVPALLISPWAERGVCSTRFDHTSFLKYLQEKWGLGSLGLRAAQANSLGSLLGQLANCRTDTIEKITLTADQLQALDPVAEAAADNMVNGHHKALSALGALLAEEAFDATPGIYPTILRYWYRIGRWFRRWLPAGWFDRDARVRGQFVLFHESQREGAIKNLAVMIRASDTPPEKLRHAIEALGYVAGEPFLKVKSPELAAKSWLELNHY